MIKHYIYDGHGSPILADLLTWCVFFENDSNRCVAETFVGEGRVSTVFMGLDIGLGEGPPILWETLVMGGPCNNQKERCAGGKEQAEAMHAAMVERVEAVMALKQ